MDIKPGLPWAGNFQDWSPWRPLVVETARRVLDYTGGTLVMLMTVLVEQYWREISTGLAEHGIAVRHFVLHADQDTLRRRIEGDTVLSPSPFRLNARGQRRRSRSSGLKATGVAAGCGGADRDDATLTALRLRAA